MKKVKKVKEEKMEKRCDNCNVVISDERLEVFPETLHCAKCVKVERFTADIDGICAQSSLTTRNGFGSSD